MGVIHMDKWKTLIFYLSLIGIFLIGYIIIGVKLDEISERNDSLQEENDSLKIKIVTLENEIALLKENPEVQFVDKNIEIDGVRRNNLNELVTVLQYKNDLYIPLHILSTSLGKSVVVSDEWIKIGDPVLYEKFLDIKITDSIDLDSLLGKPYRSVTYESICSGNEFTVKEYDGVEVNGHDITVSKPVLQTYRGITIGSTREEVENAYGKPNPINSTSEHYSYGEYNANLWFQFKDGKVVKFGRFIDDC